MWFFLSLAIIADVPKGISVVADEIETVRSVMKHGGSVRSEYYGTQQHVTTVSFTNADPSGTVLGTLKNFPYLKELDLTCAIVSDEDIKLLKGIPHLRVLTLYGTKITGSGLKGLANLKTLTELDLTLSSITDEGVVNL